MRHLLALSRVGKEGPWGRVVALFLACTMLGLSWPVNAAPIDGADYAFQQEIGAHLPLAERFTDADGRSVRLGDLFGQKPVILALGYFHCPSLCSVVRDDLFEALSRSGLTPAADYQLAVISIDPAETSKDAAEALADDRDRYPTPGSERGWHFMTGTQAAVAAISDAVGFKSRYDVHFKQFLHPAGIVILSPQGEVSGYVLGVGYKPGDVRAALALASSGGLAKAAAPLLLLCFHYDIATGRYSLEIMKVLRLAALVTVVGIFGIVALAWRRSHKGTPV